MIWVSVRFRSRDFFLLHSFQTVYGVHPSNYIFTKDLLSGVTRPECDTCVSIEYRRTSSCPCVYRRTYNLTWCCKRKPNWIGHILLRNCLLQRINDGKIQGGIEVTGRQGRRRRKLQDDLKERRGYYHLKEEALDRTIWRARFGRDFGPVVRQTTKWMNECWVRPHSSRQQGSEEGILFIQTH